MKTKKVWKIFTITEHEKEEKWLREMNKKGWKFRGFNALGLYKFEECKPEDVIYRIDYNSDEIKDKSEYIKLFKDCGWDYLQDLQGFSYFKKAASEAGEDEEIFCDEESKFEMIKRIIRGRLLALQPIWFLILIPNTIFSLSNGYYIRLAILGAVDILYLIIIVSFAIKYVRYKRKI